MFTGQLASTFDWEMIKSQRYFHIRLKNSQNEMLTPHQSLYNAFILQVTLVDIAFNELLLELSSVTRTVERCFQQLEAFLK